VRIYDGGIRGIYVRKPVLPLKMATNILPLIKEVNAVCAAAMSVLSNIQHGARCWRPSNILQHPELPATSNMVRDVGAPSHPERRGLHRVVQDFARL
jgi:hypothetical protein